MNDINPNGRPNLGRRVLGSQSLIRVIFCSVLFHLGGKRTKGWRSNLQGDKGRA
jgi:hypothetical protein